MRSVYIEFNLNEGRKTKIFELFGPYTVAADDIMIIADKYIMNKNIGEQSYDINIKVYEGISRNSIAEAELDLSNREIS